VDLEGCGDPLIDDCIRKVLLGRMVGATHDGAKGQATITIELHLD
jgi:hypothetical protein